MPPIDVAPRESARPVAAEGAARASPAHCQGGGGVRKRGLAKAVEAARAAHPDSQIDLWFQDEARVGQKGRTGHRWWLRGKRPPGLCDKRFASAYLFGTVRPATGDAFALVIPHVSTAAMSVFLAEFAATIAPGRHVVMVLDQAGWHGAKALVVPGNITLVPLPPYCPDLNRVERIWPYLRERFLSHRLLDNLDAVMDACCNACNALAAVVSALVVETRTSNGVAEVATGLAG